MMYYTLNTICTVFVCVKYGIMSPPCGQTLKRETESLMLGKCNSWHLTDKKKKNVKKYVNLKICCQILSSL